VLLPHRQEEGGAITALLASLSLRRARSQELKALGVNDSKKLTAEQRNALFATIKSSSFVKYFVDVISPQEISGKMLRR
jgi:ribonuclease HII